MEFQMIDGERQGMVLRVERASIHDGDGLRTVVFFKGCPLRCQWCSTPESQSFAQEKAADCVYGTRMSVAEVIREIRKDSLFYFLSTGGVTISGGEIMSQPEFALAILRNCKKECFNTAVETSLFGPWENMEAMVPYINTIYADLKIVHSGLHKQYCGVDNGLILENIKRAGDAAGKGLRLVLRTPIIPGINDSEEELRRMGEFCAGVNNLSHVQLLPYHRLGTATYEKLGRAYPLPDIKSPAWEHMEKCREVLRGYVGKVI